MDLSSRDLVAAARPINQGMKILCGNFVNRTKDDATTDDGRTYSECGAEQ